MIEDRKFLLLTKFIYNKRLDKIGYIPSIEYRSGFGGCYATYNAYYDVFDSTDLLVDSDFLQGNVQFVIIEMPIKESEEYNRRQIEDIKKYFGDKFFEDMILYITEEEKKAKDLENKKRAFQMLHVDLTQLTDVSIDVLAENFYLRELYSKYKRNVISKEEMLYAMVNHLSQELKRALDSNSNYFFTYEFPKEVTENEKT